MTPLPDALFVQVAALGQMLRLLENARRTLPLAPTWWLTNPELPHGFRVLVSAPDTSGSDETNLSALARQLSRDLPVVYALRLHLPDWDGTRCEAGQETEQNGGAIFARPWWQRLPGVPAAPAPWQTWGRARGLPVARLSALPPHPQNVIPYHTVAGLDRRGLLIERKQVWYVLTLPDHRPDARSL